MLVTLFILVTLVMLFMLATLITLVSSIMSSTNGNTCVGFQRGFLYKSVHTI